MFDSTPTRLAAFAAALLAAGASAAAVGAATHPAPPFEDCLAVAASRAGFGDAAPMSEAPGAGAPMVEAIPGADGRRASLAGVTLRPASTALAAGARTPWRFRLVGCDGRAIRRFDIESTKRLHLIVARTDLTGYQHLHPTLLRDGTWTVDLRTVAAGRYRAIADFVVDGRKYVVGTTLRVSGREVMTPLPAPAAVAHADGYDIELQRPARLTAGAEAQLTFRITRDGQPARDLERFLGSYGHLVALHAGDLAYSHVHPAGSDPAAGAITFNAELGAAGDTRLFMQFRAGGRVHTAAFTERVGS